MPLTLLAAAVLLSVRPSPKAHVTIDVSKAPECQAWADAAAKLVEDWYPKIVGILQAPRHDADVTLFFDPDYTGVAETGGGRIRIATAWIKKHPEDTGMVVHELTHVVQAYHHRGNPGWLVEGIADYVRFFKYEPQTKIPPPRPRNSYRNAYRVAARFLDWAQHKYDRRLVVQLDHAMRDGTYSEDIWNKTCHGSVDDIWAEYVKESTPTPAPNPPLALGPIPVTTIGRPLR